MGGWVRAWVGGCVGECAVSEEWWARAMCHGRHADCTVLLPSLPARLQSALHVPTTIPSLPRHATPPAHLQPGEAADRVAGQRRGPADDLPREVAQLLAPGVKVIDGVGGRLAGVGLRRRRQRAGREGVGSDRQNNCRNQGQQGNPASSVQHIRQCQRQAGNLSSSRRQLSCPQAAPRLPPGCTQAAPRLPPGLHLV